MPNLFESEIIERILAGDKHAFRLLVERHQAFVCSLAYRFLLNKDDAADITQETFIRLWKNIARYRPEIKITTWLYKIVTNLCLDQLKSKQRKRSLITHDISNYHIMAEAVTSDQQLLGDELRAVVIKMAEELTLKQKAVFILRDLEELEMKEISEVLAMSPGTVKSNLYYARIKMSELINTYYQEFKTEKT